MNIEKYTHIKLSDMPIYCLGDLHGAVDRLKYEITNRTLSDCIFVICGDVGIGFSNRNREIANCETLNKFLREKNIIVIGVRGNHDDPEYYNRNIENTEEKQDFWYSNFKLVPDYTVISINGKNLLLIGGATSIDRIGRITEREQLIRQFMKLYPKSTRKIAEETILPTYWDNEAVIFKPEIIEQLRNDEILITHVITHTSPDFAFPVSKNNIKSWLKYDSKLNDDINKERSTMTAIYHSLIDNYHPVEEWVYGHFHKHNQEDINGIRFTTLLHTDWQFDPYEITRLDVDEVKV